MTTQPTLPITENPYYGPLVANVTRSLRSFLNPTDYPEDVQEAIAIDVVNQLRREYLVIRKPATKEP